MREDNKKDILEFKNQEKIIISDHFFNVEKLPSNEIFINRSSLQKTNCLN